MAIGKKGSIRTAKRMEEFFSAIQKEEQKKENTEMEEDCFSDICIDMKIYY